VDEPPKKIPGLPGFGWGGCHGSKILKNHIQQKKAMHHFPEFATVASKIFQT
jgi:hypothetical protein